MLDCIPVGLGVTVLLLVVVVGALPEEEDGDDPSIIVVALEDPTVGSTGEGATNAGTARG